MSLPISTTRCTVYVSNLPFSLTNNDLHKIFEKYGSIVKVTILKNKEYRKSTGVAFIQFHKTESAEACVSGINDTKMFDRTLKASIAKDNGRSSEFMKKRKYLNKQKCYECLEEGHLSYECPTNILGNRQPPIKKQRNPRKNTIENEQNDNVDDDIHQTSDDAREYNVTESDVLDRKPKYKKSDYFSDDEELIE